MTFSQAALHLGWDTGQPHAIPERDVADVRRAGRQAGGVSFCVRGGFGPGAPSTPAPLSGKDLPSPFRGRLKFLAHSPTSLLQLQPNAGWSSLLAGTHKGYRRLDFTCIQRRNSDPSD